MVSDAQVKEVSILRQYANRLDIFKDVILVGCVALQGKAESIIESIRNDANMIDYETNNCQSLSSNTIKKYDDIIERYNLSADNSSLLGNTADDAKQKMEEINKCAYEIEDVIRKVDALITGLQERTVAYAAVIREMASNGSEQLKKRCDILEKYKEATT